MKFIVTLKNGTDWSEEHRIIVAPDIRAARVMAKAFVYGEIEDFTVQLLAYWVKASLVKDMAPHRAARRKWLSDQRKAQKQRKPDPVQAAVWKSGAKIFEQSAEFFNAPNTGANLFTKPTDEKAATP